MTQWMLDNDLLPERPPDERVLISEAMSEAGLAIDAGAKSIFDFEATTAPRPEPEDFLLDLEVVAIYW